MRIFVDGIMSPLFLGIIFHCVFILLLGTACFKRFFVRQATTSRSSRVKSSKVLDNNDVAQDVEIEVSRRLKMEKEE